jgi:predicted metalloendopeptidase
LARISHSFDDQGANSTRKAVSPIGGRDDSEHFKASEALAAQYDMYQPLLILQSMDIRL